MRRYFVALMVALLVICGMFYFEISTRREVSRWAEQVLELSKSQIFRASVASYWSRYWLFGSAAVVGVAMLIARVTDRDPSV